MKLEMEISSAKSFPPPDDGHLNFIYKWNKDSVTIKAGIQIVYYERKILKKINKVFEEVIEYEKNYIKVISFSSDKLKKQIAKNNKLAEEQNQKVRNEELKKVIEKDIEKF
jgi:predicted phage tail protein